MSANDSEQIFMYDVVAPVPTMWECMETCKHFGENVDFPSWWNGEARCLIPNGNDMKSVLFDNRWFCWCSRYEKAEG